MQNCSDIHPYNKDLKEERKGCKINYGKKQKVLDDIKIIIIFAKNLAFEMRHFNEARPVTGYEPSAAALY